MAAKPQRPATSLVPAAGLVFLLFIADAGAFGWCPRHAPADCHRRSPSAISSARRRQTLSPPGGGGIRLSSNPYTTFAVKATKLDEDDDDVGPPFRLTDRPDWKDVGKQMILNAAADAGAPAGAVTIDWKTDRIIVTVDSILAEELGGGVPELDDAEEEEDSEEEEDLEGGDDITAVDDNDEDSFDLDGDADALDELYDDEETAGKPSLLSVVARSINERLSRDGERTLGHAIAEVHEIEVTSPEFDNVLRGSAMFEAYRGFDVLVDQLPDPKKKQGKRKVMEGKLIDQDDKVTRVNVKGRVTKIKNELIVSVTLPKAKHEKGARR